MGQKVRSPRIKRLSWGRLEIEGHGFFKDGKLFPGGARAWDWGETGTDHVPGIQPADVQELLERGATVVVLSTGFQERLRVCQKTLQMLSDQRIPTHVLQPKKAARLYNDLMEQETVGALIHSTC